MEWSIKTSSKQCFVSGKNFRHGDEVLCFICRENSGEIHRFDILAEFLSSFTPSGMILGQWKKTFSSVVSSKKDLEQQIIHYEEFFFSLYDGSWSREKDILKQLFAFLLEKKRILRVFGAKNGKKQKYLHIRLKKEFIVPLEEIFPEDLTSLENIFGMFT